MTLSEFCGQRFLRYHAVSPSTRQEYGYVVKNHVAPYIGIRGSSASPKLSARVEQDLGVGCALLERTR